MLCVRLDKLVEDYLIIKYVKVCCILKDKWKYFWFIIEWFKLVNSIVLGIYKKEIFEFCFVILIYNVNGKVEFF